MTKPRWPGAIPLGLATAILGALAVFGGLNRPDRVVGLGEELPCGSVGYSVLGVIQTDRVGKAPRMARGVYWVLTLKFMNHWHLLDAKFDPSFVSLIDDRGNEHPVSEEAQKVLDSARKGEDCYGREIPPGSSCTTEVVFDLPAGVRGRELKISMRRALGDVLGGLLFGERRIRLD